MDIIIVFEKNVSTSTTIRKTEEPTMCGGGVEGKGNREIKKKKKTYNPFSFVSQSYFGYFMASRSAQAQNIQ